MKNNKFRLWCKNKNEWESNDWAILHNDSLVEIRNNRIISISNKTHILMQSTGLKDKNGKEIFDGDIIKRERYTDYENYCNVDEIYGYIEQKDCAWCIIQNDNGTHFTTPLFMEMEFGDVDRIQVMGNIYENPELIK